ncbi:MAG: hypothetical protein M3458_05445 [Acidobacteriota bacterium]|nr:hypothetical protein [Acidobacteriota bacterium]
MKEIALSFAHLIGIILLMMIAVSTAAVAQWANPETVDNGRQTGTTQTQTLLVNDASR